MICIGYLLLSCVLLGAKGLMEVCSVLLSFLFVVLIGGTHLRFILFSENVTVLKDETWTNKQYCSLQLHCFIQIYYA